MDRRRSALGVTHLWSVSGRGGGRRDGGGLQVARAAQRRGCLQVARAARVCMWAVLEPAPGPQFCR